MSDNTEGWKAELKSCKSCGKSGQFDFCSKDCMEKYKQEREENKKSDLEPAKNLQHSEHKENAFADELKDGAFQKGIHWRKNKIEVIYKARKAKVPDQEILRQLRLGGITIQKSRELMRDSEELYGRGERDEV